MFRWVFITVVVLVVFNGLWPWLRKIGLGRLPGDMHFKFRGREWDLPIGTTLLLSVMAAAVARWV